MKQEKGRISLRASAVMVSSCLFLFVAVGWICADTLFGESLCGFLAGQSADRAVSVTVPDLTGSRFSVDEMADSDLFDISVTYVYSPEPARQVLEQSPAAGAHRKVIPGRRRTALHLTVSMGRAVHRVPELTGKSRRDAEIALRNAGLTADIRVESRIGASCGAEHTNLHAGCVLRTDPPAGAQLAEGDAVVLYVAPDGPEESAVCPDAVGLDLAAAREVLAHAGLEVGRVVWRPDADALPGTVLEQALAPGCQLPVGTAVDLFVAIRPAGAGQASPEPEDTQEPPPRLPWLPHI